MTVQFRPAWIKLQLWLCVLTVCAGCTGRVQGGTPTPAAPQQNVHEPAGAAAADAGVGGRGGAAASSAQGGRSALAAGGGGAPAGGAGGAASAGRSGNMGQGAPVQDPVDPPAADGGMPPSAAPGITLRPGAGTLVYGATVTFLCTVTGYTDASCKFTSDGGAGQDSGVGKWTYTAPSSAGTYKITATASADPKLSATVTIRVVEPGAAGEWVEVTPTPMRAAIDGVETSMRYGVQDVVVDPARPSDLYAFLCYAGVWRSEDYGATWRKVSQSPELETGRPWTAGIDTNLSRDKSTPPTLYTVNGYGSSLGLFKSTDWGVSWTRHALTAAEGQDAYSIDVDPYDGDHLLLGFHETRGLIESTDGARTWKSIAIPGDSGVSVYGFFVDTGDPASTRRTWLTIPQADNSSATYRTENAGSSWTKVDSFGHSHGSCQIFQQGDGVIYAGGLYGSAGNSIYRSVDFGKTWKGTVSTVSTTIAGTPSYLYSSNAQAWGPGSAGLYRATRASGMDWQSMDNPAGMIEGAKRAGVTHDGTHQIVLSGNWKAGIWRYVEP